MTNLTDDFILKCQAGVPYLFDDICMIYPRTIKEIIEIGFSKFQNYLAVLTKNFSFGEKLEQVEEAFKNFSDFEKFLFMVSIDKELMQTAKEAFFFFTNENVIFSTSPAQIVIGPLQEKHTISEEKFFDLRHILRKMYFLDADEEEIIFLETDSPKVRKLKEQMLENRKKVAAAKAKQSEKEGLDDLAFSDILNSFILRCPGVDVYNLTYYSFNDLQRRIKWKELYESNVRSALAGAKMKKNDLDFWVKSISSNKN